MAIMALTRVWTPSPNYSGGSTKRLLVLHTMEGFTGPNGAADCANYFRGDVGASSHVCIDNYHANKVWECVSRGNGAWTQCNYNSVSVSCEQAGYASWSREKWLNEQSTLLHTTATWLAEESKKLGIPLVALNASQSQGGSWGVTQHSYLGSYGCGHSDCGSGYPMDKVIEWAKGGSPAPVSGGYYMTCSVAIDPNGKEHWAAVWDEPEHRVNYKPPGGSWVSVDPGSSAKSGAGITIGNGGIMITYTNTSGQACAYRKPLSGGKWTWLSVGPDGGKVM